MFDSCYCRGIDNFFTEVAHHFQARRGGIPYVSGSCKRSIKRIERKRRLELMEVRTSTEEEARNNGDVAIDEWIAMIDEYNTNKEA